MSYFGIWSEILLNLRGRFYLLVLSIVVVSRKLPCRDSHTALSQPCPVLFRGNEHIYKWTHQFATMKSFEIFTLDVSMSLSVETLRRWSSSRWRIELLLALPTFRQPMTRIKRWSMLDLCVQRAFTKNRVTRVITRCMCLVITTPSFQTRHHISRALALARGQVKCLYDVYCLF